MKRSILFYVVVLLCTIGCTKAIDPLTDKTQAAAENSSQFTEYKIRQGQHSSDQSTFKMFEATELKFVVKFDSSAVYTSKTKENQYDINKLYGFSDNAGDHHKFSARFGWGWSDKALRLYAYVYNDGKRTSKELGTVSIGKEVACSIKATDSSYIFTMDGITASMLRTSKLPTPKGYMLYPYFGGDETAPHDVIIRIKNQ